MFPEYWPFFFDGFVKSPSVPLGAGLRLTPQFWRVLHQELLRNHRFGDFYEIIFFFALFSRLKWKL